LTNSERLYTIFTKEIIIRTLWPKGSGKYLLTIWIAMYSILYIAKI
jgi:hypothetical protein